MSGLWRGQCLSCHNAPALPCDGRPGAGGQHRPQHGLLPGGRHAGQGVHRPAEGADGAAGSEVAALVVADLEAAQLAGGDQAVPAGGLFCHLLAAGVHTPQYRRRV
jgi:hypothetical protein